MLEHLGTDLFQSWYDARHYYTPEFDFSLNDFDVHLRSHLHSYSHSVVKLPEATQIFTMVDYMKEMTEEVMYGEYGLFKHLLFLVS